MVIFYIQKEPRRLPFGEGHDAIGGKARDSTKKLPGKFFCLYKNRSQKIYNITTAVVKFIAPYEFRTVPPPLDPFRAPKNPPCTNPKEIVAKNGFRVVKALESWVWFETGQSTHLEQAVAPVVDGNAVVIVAPKRSEVSSVRRK